MQVALVMFGSPWAVSFRKMRARDYLDLRRVNLRPDQVASIELIL